MLESRAVILAKVETTYGTDATPTPANDAILTTKPSIELIEDNRKREVVLPNMGSLADIPVATGIKISFGVELRGSGTATTPPRIGALLRAAGFTQTVGASDVRYTPNSAQDIESVTIYFYQDGILYKALGCVCNSMKISMKANDIAKMDFEFTGLFGGAASFATDQSFPTPTFGDSPTPPLLQSASFVFGAYSSAILETLEVNCSNTIAKRPNANSPYGVYRYSRTAREITGSFDPEIVSLSTWNPWSIYEAGTTGQLQCTVGSNTGNMCVITIPRAQLSAPKLSAREGIQTYSINFKSVIILSAGNDDIEIKFN